MKIELLKLSLQNFKGITLSVDFTHETTILGANGSGKTRLYDSFLWLLFGKDSSGRSDFELKKRLPNGEEEHKTEISVTGVFTVDGTQKSLKRIFTERWEKKRGSSTEEYKGNETSFEIDMVPKNKTEYTAFVSSLIDESLFRLICSTSYFNALKWQDRREMLIQAVGEPTLEEVAGTNKSFIELSKKISGKSLDEFRAMIKAKKKPIKEERDRIAPMIEQEKTHIVDILDPTPKIEENEQKIKSIEEQISGQLNSVEEANKDVNLKLNTLYQEIGQLENEKTSIENKFKVAYNNNIQNQESEKKILEDSIKTAESLISTGENHLPSFAERIESTKSKLKALGESYKKTQSGEIDKVCPTCGSEFTGEKFEEKKEAILKEIESEGSTLKELYTKLVNQEKNIRQNIEESKAKLQELKFKFQQNSELSFKHYVTEYNEDSRHREIVQLIDSKKKEIEEITSFKQEAPDTSSLREQIRVLREENDKLKQNLFLLKKSNESVKKVEELEKRERDLSIELADLEKTEITAEEFTKAKIEMVSERVNSLFSYVDWKMYETQVNGGEKEICECTVDGVPYGTLNTAKKVNAGLDIINAFSKIYNLYSPIWIDNRESVTEILPTESQIINLIVSPENKSLTFK